MSRFGFVAVAVFAWHALPGSALGAQLLPRNPALRDVLAYALRENPDLVTARLRADSAHGEQRIARALSNPALSVVPGNPTQYVANAAFDLGPDRVFRTRAAAQASAAARLDVDDVTRQVTFSVRQGFFDLLLAEAVHGIARGQDSTVRRLLQADSARFEAGDLALRDVSITELLFAHAEANLSRADAAARAARVSLQLLMGVRSPRTDFTVAGRLEYAELVIPVDSLMAIAQANRPDAAAAREREDQSRSLRARASALLVPVPGLNAVYQPAQPFASGSNYALGLSLVVPLWYWFGGERERAEAGVRAAAVARERTGATLESDVTTALDGFAAARVLARRYASGLLARAADAVEIQRFAYENGNASLTDLLTAINAFGDIQTDYYTALHDYWVGAYAVDRAVGRDLVP